MTQSVELTLEVAADLAVREQWARLAEAGLPTEQRRQPAPSHRPHVTLFAGDTLAVDADERLPEVLAGLELSLRIGSALLFGPRRATFVLVRQVVVTRELLELQAAVAAVCGADPEGHFGPGHWTPHVTLARRVPTAQVGAALAALGDLPDLVAVSRRCRRWDSERRETWELTGG
jgi:2'-5' RNA ligase